MGGGGGGIVRDRKEKMRSGNGSRSERETNDQYQRKGNRITESPFISSFQINSYQTLLLKIKDWSRFNFPLSVSITA